MWLSAQLDVIDDRPALTVWIPLVISQVSPSFCSNLCQVSLILTLNCLDVHVWLLSGKPSQAEFFPSDSAQRILATCSPSIIASCERMWFGVRKEILKLSSIAVAVDSVGAVVVTHLYTQVLAWVSYLPSPLVFILLWSSHLVMLETIKTFKVNCLSWIFTRWYGIIPSLSWLLSCQPSEEN